MPRIALDASGVPTVVTRSRATKGVSYTTTAADDIVEATATPMTVTLGSLLTTFEQLVYNASSGNVTVGVVSGKKLDGTTDGTATLATKTGKHYYCDGAGNWNTC